MLLFELDCVDSLLHVASGYTVKVLFLRVSGPDSNGLLCLVLSGPVHFLIGNFFHLSRGYRAKVPLGLLSNIPHDLTVSCEFGLFLVLDYFPVFLSSLIENRILTVCELFPYVSLLRSHLSVLGTAELDRLGESGVVLCDFDLLLKCAFFVVKLFYSVLQ